MTKRLTKIFLALSLLVAPLANARQSGGGNSMGGFPAEISSRLAVFAQAVPRSGSLDVCFSTGSTLDNQPYTVMLLFTGGDGTYIAQFLRTGGYTVQNPSILQSEPARLAKGLVSFRGLLATDDQTTAVFHLSLLEGKTVLTGSLEQTPLNADELTCQPAR